MRKQLIKNSIAIVCLFLLALVLNINLLTPLVLSTILIYLVVWRTKHMPGECSVLHLLLLFLIIFVIGYWSGRGEFNIYYIPFSLIPMLAIILWQDLMISLILAVAFSFALGFEFGNLNLAFFSFISAIISSVLLINVRQRSQIIRAGFIVGLLQAVSCLIIQDFPIHRSAGSYIILFINGIACGILVIGLLPIFEYLFRQITNISLLELSDFNHPILRRMMLEAAGTYHHSLVVGNISEAASEEVGANSLLARIGAYYHDIGKIEKAEYFSENQIMGASKHENLQPSMSKLVIINHVKDGEALARRYHLNSKLIDFILQHHGTSLVYYFYHRALEESEEDAQMLKEGFRYPGPRPTSRETAIVLLADSAEAACRALKNPTPNKIEQVVHKVINNKFIDGQLDECDLTLKDLEKISGIFIRLLTGIYHTRVSYPKSSISVS